MTVTKHRMGPSIKRALLETRSLTFMILLIIFVSLFSEEVTAFTLDGLRLAIKHVIPSAFPAMLLSDLYVSYGTPESISVLRVLFSGMFGIGPSGLRAYVLGNLCGFPLGARAAAEAYERGELCRGEAERLIPLSSNPSAAFVIGGVGLGMLGNTKLGILLLISLYASSIVCGIVFRTKPKYNSIMPDRTRQSYNLIKSISSSAESSLIITAFVTAFSIVGGFIEKYVRGKLLRTVMLSVCEVTVGVKYFSVFNEYGAITSFGLIAFTLGFGGISVMLQSAAFIKKSKLSMSKYVPMKLLQAFLCAFIAVLLYLFIG